MRRKDRDKRLIRNWRTIFLLNIDYKIVSKAVVTFLKKHLCLITHQETAYIQNRRISETGR